LKITSETTKEKRYYLWITFYFFIKITNNVYIDSKNISKK
jgi:hypothetical protein